MRIPPALAADLALLTDALDADGVDIASAVSLLTAAVTACVSSYHGLSVRVSSPDGHLEMTTLPDQDATARSVTSLRIPVPVATGPPPAGPSVMIVLYAGLPGAFVDLAADLAWLTGRDLDDSGLDADLGERALPTTSLGAQASINQAVGVLIGRGLTPEAALVELEARASGAGSGRRTAAVALLDALPSTAADVSNETE